LYRWNNSVFRFCRRGSSAHNVGAYLICVLNKLSYRQLQVACGKLILFGEQHPAYDIELTRCIRHFPFDPVPPVDYEHVLKSLRTYVPGSEIYDPLLDIVYSECGPTLFSALTPDLHTLGCFFALLSLGCLFAVPGPGETPEVRHFARLSAAAIGAASVLSYPSLDLIECLYARALLELFRQTMMEEVARSLLKMACQMCYDVSTTFFIAVTAMIPTPRCSWVFASPYNLLSTIINGPIDMDRARWRTFTAEELNRRRLVFWMVFTTDTFQVSRSKGVRPIPSCKIFYFI
jgi:hypothetical protein